MRVLMVLGNLEVGGAERTAVGLADGLGRAGAAVHVAALKGGGQLGDAFRRAGATLHEGLLRFRFDPTAALRIGRLIRRERIEAMILVDVYRNAMFCGLWGARLSGRRVRRILWCKSVPTGQAGDFAPRLRGYFRRGMLREIVCTSDWQRKVLAERRLPADRMSVIHNGVDVDRFARARPVELGAADDRPMLVQVANVMPDKDFDTLLAAADILHRRSVPFRLALAGRGTDSPEMLHRIEKLALGGTVLPLGQRCDVPEILAAAEAMVLSSRSEVFSVSVLEAMAAGRAVIVSDLVGFEEMFTDGREGLKVPPGDANALANAIEKLLGDENLRSRLSAAAAIRAEDFRSERMCEKFAELLNG